MRYRRLSNETPEQLHQMALTTDTSFAIFLAKHHGTSAETLHYLIHKNIFEIPRMMRKNKDDITCEMSISDRKFLWESAAFNTALGTEDLVWLYEQVLPSIENGMEKDLSPHDINYHDIQILKGIGVHRNTPEEIVKNIKAIRLNGHQILLKNDFALRDEREIEQQWKNLRKRQGLFDNMVPSLPSNPNALPTKENGGLLG